MNITTEFEKRWQSLDDKIKTWWDGDFSRANEKEIRNDPKGTLLYLPHPYSTAGGSESAFPEMYGWDTYFINLALLEHGRFDLVRNHIVNHLFMIEKHGMVLNGNRDYYLTRSQTPLLAEGIWRYHQKHPDKDLLCMAFPLLKKEYNNYWLAEHHQTPTGLATNRDLGDPNWRPELAAEAEITDFTPCFDGDVRQCNPVATNCALIQYANNIAKIAGELGWPEQAQEWQKEAQKRTELVQKYCWDEEQGFFFDYHFIRQERLPYWSVLGFWPMWVNIATPAQAEKMMQNLEKFNQPHGLTSTAEQYASPHPEYEWVQFNYPAGWPPMHVMPVEGLITYGYEKQAKEVCHKLLNLMLDLYDKTGKLWEKYNVVKGDLDLPKERYASEPMHGFISASVVILGRLLLK